MKYLLLTWKEITKCFSISWTITASISVSNIAVKCMRYTTLPEGKEIFQLVLFSGFPLLIFHSFFKSSRCASCLSSWDGKRSFGWMVGGGGFKSAPGVWGGESGKDEPRKSSQARTGTFSLCIIYIYTLLREILAYANGNRRNKEFARNDLQGSTPRSGPKGGDTELLASLFPMASESSKTSWRAGNRVSA